MIDFSGWAPTKQALYDSWVEAGIMEIDQETGEYRITDEYKGVEIAPWNGKVEDVPAVMAPDGTVITDAVMVDGYHFDVRVTGPLVDEMTYTLEQYETDGTLKNVFDRTWATNLFGLQQTSKDTKTGFPGGYRNAKHNVWYCDKRDFKSPSHGWL